MIWELHGAIFDTFTQVKTCGQHPGRMSGLGRGLFLCLYFLCCGNKASRDRYVGWLVGRSVGFNTTFKKFKICSFNDTFPAEAYSCLQVCVYMLQSNLNIFLGAKAPLGLAMGVTVSVSHEKVSKLQDLATTSYIRYLPTICPRFCFT